MKKVFAALAALALLASPAVAQTGAPRTTTYLNNEVNTVFADNTSGAITPAEARQLYLDFIQSFANQTSGGLFNITNDCASTSGARAVIFICNDASGNAAGQNVGLQIWIGSTLTATPGVNNFVAFTSYIDNLNGRAQIWNYNPICHQ